MKALFMRVKFFHSEGGRSRPPTQENYKLLWEYNKCVISHIIVGFTN